MVVGGACVGLLALAGPAVAADRGFELVPPSDSTAYIERLGSFSTPSGDAAIFSSYDSLAGSVHNGPKFAIDSYIGRRGSGGWDTAWATNTGSALIPGTGSRTLFASDDGSRTVMVTEGGVDPADTVPQSQDPYLVADGHSTWLTPFARASTAETVDAVAANADLSEILISSNAQLLPADTDAFNDVYLWKNGALTLLTPGTPNAVTPPVVGKLGVPGLRSDDGSKVFGVAQDALVPGDTDSQGDLYRFDGGVPKLMSPDRRSTPLQPATVVFTGASADGDVACFTTAQKLTDDDGDTRADLYCYRASTDTLDRSSTGTNDADINAVTGLAVSRDGSSAFFATNSALVPADTDATTSLYRRVGGVTQYVSRLVAGDAGAGGRANTSSANRRGLKIAGDGSWAVFVTSAPALPDDVDGQPDVYRWVAGSGLTRLSKGVAPGADNGPDAAEIGNGDYVTTDFYTQNPLTGRVVADGGQVVFFTTTESLVSEDTDGGRADVYEWDAATGSVVLDTPAGSAPFNAYYVDNSTDGSSLFFNTGEPIVPQDLNGDVADLYVACVGGGFAPPAESTLGAPPGAAGPASPVPPSTPTSAGPVAGGNVTPTPNTEPSTTPGGTPKARVSTATRRVRARDGAVAIAVTVTAPGTVSLGVRPAHTTASTRHTFSRAGTATVRLRLTAAARKRLARHGSITARITLRFTPHSGSPVTATRTITITGAAR
jgi:hypothetical protein